MPPGSLHRDGVDAEELRRMRLAVVLLRHVWLEILRTGPLDLPQLTSERRASYCWKYALEAIINWLLLYFLVHDNRLLSMLELY